jgi:membrane protein implicated in regulation of membrane protease activity
LKEFVSGHRISVAVLVALMSVVCAIFVPYGFPWTGLAWASLALLAAALMAMRSTRSIRQVIDDVETEARPAATAQERAPIPSGGAQLRVEGEATP